MPSPMSATPNRLPLTISIIRLMPRPSRAASGPLEPAPASSAPVPPASHARAPSSDTSPVGTPTVPSLGLRRLIVKPLAEPSGRMRGTM